MIVYQFENSNEKVEIFQDSQPHPPGMIFDHAFLFYFFDQVKSYGCDHDYLNQEEVYTRFAKGNYSIFMIYCITHENGKIEFIPYTKKDDRCKPENQGFAVANFDTLKEVMGTLDPDLQFERLIYEMDNWKHYFNNEVYQVIYYEDHEPVEGKTIFGFLNAAKVIDQQKPHLLDLDLLQKLYPYPSSIYA